MKQWQINQLESLYRKAVLLQANPAGGQASCEAGCGRLGTDAHHFILRSQEPGLRWQYEPRWGLWLCSGCHMKGHTYPGFREAVLTKLWQYRPARARALERFAAMHNRLTCKNVAFEWMRAYLQRCIERRMRDWSQAYYCEVD